MKMRLPILMLILMLNSALFGQFIRIDSLTGPQLGHSTFGWVESDNGSPWSWDDGQSIQKNPVVNDFVHAIATLEAGYIYRYTFYLKAREDSVYGIFKESDLLGTGGNELQWSYAQTGTDDYTTEEGSFVIKAGPAAEYGTDYKYTSGPITGDDQDHYLKVVITKVNGGALSKPLRVDHFVLERKVDLENAIPPSPGSFKFTGYSDSVQFWWNDKSAFEDGFKILRRTIENETYIEVAKLAPDMTNYIDKSLTKNTIYYYKVCAYNDNGTKYSDSLKVAIYDSKPAALNIFDGTAITSQRIDLYWEESNSNEYGFIVEQKTGENWIQITSNPLPENRDRLVIDRLNPDTSYEYRIFTYNNMGNSDTAYTTISTPIPDESDGIIFPLDASYVNVRDHGAEGDGITDDTEAIQAAMNEANATDNKFVYFPIGTYLISSRLEWAEGSRVPPLTLIGQSREKTIIQLTDNNILYQNQLLPRSMIWTRDMDSADNFRNYIRNMTLNTGNNNPGAVGLQFMSNNMGAVVDVNIISGDGSGKIGLDLAYNDMNGPLLIKHVKVSGFDIGVKTAGSVNSQTMEHITLENQNTYGISNGGQVLSLRKITSTNQVPAVYNKSSSAVMTLLEASLNGGGSENSAIINEGALFAREIHTSGYETAIENKSGHQTDSIGPNVSEFVSHDVATLFEWTAPLSLNLEIKETPAIPISSDMSKWANILDFGASPQNPDNRQAIQDAINSGAGIVYMPAGDYPVSGTIELTGNVELIMGFESLIVVGEQTEAVFELVNNSQSPDTVEFQNISVTPGVTTPAVNNSSDSRTLVLKYSKGLGGTHTGTGDVFYEDIGTGVHKPLKFLGGEGQHAWIRQLSNEPRENVVHLENNGSTVWILGHKTEQPGTLVHTKNGGKTEICGAFVYSVGGENGPYPMYINDNSYMSATMGGAFYTDDYGTYTTLVEETQDGIGKTLPASELPARNNFRLIPLYVGVPDTSVVSIDAIRSENDGLLISVYPNPSNGDIHLCSSESNPVKTDVIDLGGHIVWKETLEFTNGNARLNLSWLADGCYILKVWNQHIAETFKINISH